MCTNILNDIIVYSTTIEQHLKDLVSVFQILRENKLKINLEKCHFCMFEVEALGHKVTKKGLLLLENKVKAINNLDTPTNVTELRSFLGMIGYYRNFIDNYASLSSPLCGLLRKNVSYIWTDEHTKSFNKLKETLVNAPILCYPRYDNPFIIRSDASFQRIGGVLLQLFKDKIEHPVYYVSRSLKKSERNYAITELEGTAAFYCVEKFKPYILGNPYQTVLYTDHQPLIPLIRKCEPNTSKHTRWCSLFSQLQVNVIYQPGKANIIADALSRIKRKEDIIVNSLLEEENNNTNKNNNENKNSDENILEETNSKESEEENDEEDNGSNNSKENYNNNTNDSPEINSISIDEIENEKYISEFMKKFLQDRIISIDGKNYIKDKEKFREVIDDYMEKIKIIGIAHRIGHDGIQRTYERIKQKYYWKNMIIDIKKYISCKICQLTRS